MKNICLILIASCGLQISLLGQFSSMPVNATASVDLRLSISNWENTPDYDLWQQAFNTYFEPYVSYWFDRIPTPFAVQVQNDLGNPIAGVKISLIDEQKKEENYVFTGIDGKAMLWPKSDHQQYTIQANYKTITKQLKKPRNATIAANTIVLKHGCQQLEGTDILALVDATHSMGDEFEAIIHALQDFDATVMLGRDVGERYLVKPIDIANQQTFTNQAAGGGKHEEAIEQVLLAALQKHQWNTEATSRILLFFTDALPQRSEKAADILKEVIRYANHNNIRIYPVAASGLNEEGEFLLQSLALFTGGIYSWLNDTPGNNISHRIPLVTGSTQSNNLAEWLKALTDQHQHFNNCPQLKQVVQTKEAPDVYCAPNPATNHTSVNFPNEMQSITVYNEEGKVQGKWNKLQHKIYSFPVDDWPAGIYRVEAQSGKQLYHANLLVVH